MDTAGQRERLSRTEDARHDGDARVLGLALGVVDAQDPDRREADGLVAGHGGRSRQAGGERASGWSKLLLLLLP